MAGHHFDIVRKPAQNIHAFCEIKRGFLVPSQAVDVADGDALEKGDDEQGEVAAKVVEEHEDVAAGAVGEAQGEQAAGEADGAGEDLFAQVREELHVHDGRDDALQRAELRVDAQREQHQEEQHRPELRARELVDSLGEDYEGQACSRGGLFGKQKNL